MATDLPQRAQLQPEIAPGAPAVDSRLVASWRRSEDYGVPLESVSPGFSGAGDDDSLFARCGRQVLTDLSRTLADEPVGLMLTDADGLVLSRFSGDTSLLGALDAVHLAPGFSYAEREAGTNGVGLALADRVPTVVRAEEHYALSLCAYTCAAVPVLDPVTGHLEGSVNLTTWSRSSSDLLLALAQAAAGSTASLMLARSRGRRARTAPPGRVVRVDALRLEPGAGTVTDLGPGWVAARTRARQALTTGRVVAAVGEPGAGRATVLAQAVRAARPRERILAARPPEPHHVATWLDLWTPEVGKDATSLIVSDVDTLPRWAQDRVEALLLGAVGPAGASVSLTAQRLDLLPATLAALVDTVVEVHPLRERPEDVLPLARHLARRVRGRDVALSPAAAAALGDHDWPGNTEELRRVVAEAAAHGDVVDLRHLPAAVVSRPGHRLSRIETFERDEIVRVLSRPGSTMGRAASELGMSRATVYRKIGHYGIRLPRA